MAEQEIKKNLNELFPDFSDPELQAMILHHGQKKVFKEGEILMEPGRTFSQVPLILEGSLRILREDEEGRELFLYYLQEGETCAVSLNCCMVGGESEIRAIAETELTVLFVPIRFLDAWMEEYPCWKHFIMNTYRQRFEELLQTIDSIAFHKMDERVLQYLKEKSIALNTNQIHTTHQKIADDLHSTREVISRLLKQMEKQELLRLGRNLIEIQ